MLRMRANNLDHEFVVVCKLIKSRKLVGCTSSTASRSSWQQLKPCLATATAFARSHKRITRFCGCVDCSLLPPIVSQMLQVLVVNSWFAYTRVDGNALRGYVAFVVSLLCWQFKSESTCNSGNCCHYLRCNKLHLNAIASWFLHFLRLPDLCRQ